MRAALLFMVAFVLIANVAMAQNPRGFEVTLGPGEGVTVDCGLVSPHFPYRVVSPKLITHWNPTTSGNSYLASVGSTPVAVADRWEEAASTGGTALSVRQWQMSTPLVFDPMSRFVWIYNVSGASTYTIYMIVEY
jgi:hypothetical protein